MAKNNHKPTIFTLNCRGKLRVLDRPWVMGILNINHDSFYEGSRFTDLQDILEKATQMAKEGADIIDIGGQSTRPGSERISAEEEIKRVIPVIDLLASRLENTLISVDTYHAEVARVSAGAGASMINDISGGEMDPRMPEVVATLEVPYVCMHMKGVPETMQQNIAYDNILTEVFDFFSKKIHELVRAGVHDIIIDPGIGFGKTMANNFHLLKNLSVFQQFERPVMAGVSRKSFIYKTLGVTPDKALNGTTVMHTIALMEGANILRVHDVQEARETVQLLQAYKKAQTPGDNHQAFKE
jgi:dihydropteroate synthase